MHIRVVPARIASVAALLALTGTVAASPALAGPSAGPDRIGEHVGSSSPVVVVRGLNNPRQLSVTPGGSLLVGEGGRGGDRCVNLGGEAGETCFGATGSISWVPLPFLQRNSTPVRVVTGLLSGGARGGAGASGPDGVASTGAGGIVFAEFGVPPELVPAGLDSGMAGKLMGTRPFGTPRPLADLRAFELANDPDGQGPDANPHAVLALPGRVLVADAAGNDILQVRDGRLGTFAVLPNVTDGACAGRPNEGGTTGCDAVPTSLAAGPDGSVYVGLLSGLAPGAGRVLRLDGRTGRIEREWSGLTAVTGVAVGPDGSVYASQMFTSAGPAGPDPDSGRVTRIAPDGSRTDVAVPLPAGLAVSGHSLYVAAWSTAPDSGLGIPDVDSSGQVWRLRV